MPIKKLLDKAGTSLTVVDVDGCYFPVFNLKNLEEDLRSVSGWQARNSDIMICAYPKSGTHWLWEVTTMLVKKRAERIPCTKDTAMIELIAKSEIENMTSPRVLNSHLCFEHLPKDFAKRKCKIVYVMRNPKDVAVSFFNHHRSILDYDFSGKWDDYVPRYLKGDVDYGTWFDYTLKWEKFMADNPEYPIFSTTYEDMKEDTLSVVTQLAKFLELDCDQLFLQEVINLCQFDCMKKNSPVRSCLVVGSGMYQQYIEKVKLEIGRTGSRWSRVNCLIEFTRIE